MTTLQTLEMALEALEPDRNRDHWEVARDRQKAITAIRQQIALEKKAENERELGIQMQPDEPVVWDVFNKHGRIYFAIGNQSFPVDYTPEDEPECSAGQAAEWYMDQLRHALKTLSETRPQPAAWVGLTRDELFEIAGDSPDYFDWKVFAHAIEAKLKEKNT